MQLTHLGLPVSDVAVTQRFYATYFGFDPTTAQRYPDGTVIVRDADGFDLALHPVERVGPLPEFLHFGFRLGAPDEVRRLGERLAADGVPLVEREDEEGYVGFKCTDPDGHRVETYWEPGRPG